LIAIKTIRLRLKKCRKARETGMNMKRFLLIGSLTILAALTACTTPQQRAAQQAQLDAYDDQQCQELGFRPGSQAYGNCRLRMREIRATEGSYRSSQPNVSLGVGVMRGF